MKNILGNILLVIFYIMLFVMVSVFVIGTIRFIVIGIERGSTTIYYQDNDKDGYGNDRARTIRFDEEPEPPGYATKVGDCDDSNPTINPGAGEIEGNALDENCDGITDPQKAVKK